MRFSLLLSLSVLSLFTLSGISNATNNYRVSISHDNLTVNVVQYDEQGFDGKGIHEDTGTLYDPSGFDKDGFNSNGEGIKVCEISGTSPKSFTSNHYGGGNMGLMWRDDNVGSIMSDSPVSYFIYQGAKYEYGGSRGGWRIGGMDHGVICRTPIKP